MSETNVTTTPEMRLEVVMLPIADFDRSIKFYTEKMGFHLDHDVVYGEMRIVQLTPVGSACSIVLASGPMASGMTPGSIKGLHLVVQNAQQIHDLFAERGIEVSDIVDMGGIKYVFLSDPDGNTWEMQELGVHSPS